MICLYCGKKIASEALTCPYCGKKTEIELRFCYIPSRAPIEQVKNIELPAAKIESPIKNENPEIINESPSGNTLKKNTSKNKTQNNTVGNDDTNRKRINKSFIMSISGMVLFAVAAIFFMIIIRNLNKKAENSTESINDMPETVVSMTQDIIDTPEFVVSDTPEAKYEFETTVNPAMDTPNPISTDHPDNQVGTQFKLIFNINLPKLYSPLGNEKTPEPIMIQQNEPINLPEAELNGYEFDGWNSNSDGTGTSYPVGKQIIEINEDMTLYAQWIKSVSTEGENETLEKTDVESSFKIFFEKNLPLSKDNHPAYDWPEPIIFNNDNPIYLPSVAIDGYEFLSWNTEPDGSGDTYLAGQRFPELTENVTLYAQWRQLAVPVTEVSFI